MSHSLIARVLVLLGIWIIALLPLFFMGGPELSPSASPAAARDGHVTRVSDPN